MNSSEPTRRQFVQQSAAAGAMLTLPGGAVTGAASSPDIEARVPKRGIYSLRPAPRWEEALLIGNGKMGGLVMSKPFDETIIITHERLYLPDHEARPPADLSKVMPDVRRLIREAKYHDAAKLAFDETVKQGYPNGLVWTDPFFPAFDLRIKLDNAREPTDYRRALDYAEGLSYVQWTDDDTRYLQRAFISRADDVLVVELTASGKKKLSGHVSLAQHPFDGPGKMRDDKFIESTLITADGPYLAYHCRYALTDGGYCGVARVVATGGKLTTEGGIRVDGAYRVVVLLRLQPLEPFDDAVAAKVRQDLQALIPEFSTRVSDHIEKHRAIYTRQSIDLGGDPAERALPAEELYAKTHHKQTTPALLERVFDAGRYAILCASGEMPPNLQGIWAGSWNTPWRGDYTQNGNVPSAIANMLNGNMPELMLSYTGYLESLLPHLRANAKRQHGCRGIQLGHRTARHGYHLHYTEKWCHHFWTSGAAWAAGFFYDYYQYTGDETFLKERAFPWMKEAALFYEDFLQENDDGVYEFNPSYSPENTPAG
ncbi:MAG: glycoside hydrolase N-terminal domain-containing protein, partial [Rhodospirillales bacterium]|nr:glycoside hydrolase N-terminal domain-containing protein [Rhodospirillales bacterium]